MMKKLVLVALALGMSLGLQSQTSDQVSPREGSCDAKTPKLMILGVYHMGNPGQDQFGTKADDVLSPERQKQIAEVLDKLAAYRPNKIAVEGDFKTQRAAKEYTDYLKGNYQLTRNEIDQLGYVLAKRLGHPRFYPVDFPMWMDGRVPAEIGTPKPRPASEKKKDDADDSPHETPAIYVEAQKLLPVSTVLEYLRFVNSDRYVAADGATYMSLLKPDLYSDSLYGNADLLTNWYKRNFRILTNVNRVAETNDRILLMIGSGHLKILRDLAVESPDICLMDTEEYLK
jgi:hypothetical protein